MTSSPAGPPVNTWNCSRAALMFLIVPLVVQNVFSALLKPISEQIQAVQNFREKNRGSKLFNHLSAVSESIPALGWVAMVRAALGAALLGRVGRVAPC